MVKRKIGKIRKEELLLFALLVIFPFGQLLRYRFLLIDVLAIISFVWFLFSKKINLRKLNKINGFLIAILFSFVFSLTLFSLQKTLIGFLYLIRFFAYISIYFLTQDLVKKRRNKKTLINSLILISVFIAFFGWIQYFFYPDFRNFSIWGWDKHLYRLIGTFMDPGFTGILLVLGFILSFGQFLKQKRKQYFLISIILFISVLFTYSRASILALFFGSIPLLIFARKEMKSILLKFLILFIAGLILLPRPAGAGVKLERLFSVFARLQNYKETFAIWKQSPVFGIGFNNLCIARNVFIEQTFSLSHSCSGSDSSILMVLATTGIVGLMTFIDSVKDLIKKINNNIQGKILLSSIIAIFVHSLFVNSLFYPFVLAWMAILLGSEIEN